MIDDGSPDGTADRPRSSTWTSAASRCCAAGAKSGLGSAYRAGFRVGLARGYDVMIEMDADLSHDPAVLPDLVAAVEQGADLAIGSRYVPGGSIPDWKWRPPRHLAWSAASTRAPCSGCSVQDATAGFRAYHRRRPLARSTSTTCGPTATASRWR